MKYLILVTILKLCSSSFSIDASQLPASEVTAHPRQNVSTGSQQTEDSLKEMMKQRWLKILHLARMPEGIPRKVPQYMQALFSAIEANPSASVEVDPDSSGDQAAFAIKAFNAYYEAENLSVFFNVLLDFNSSMISKVEFVFEVNTDQENSSTSHEYAQLQCPAIKVCDVNRTSCYVSEPTQRRQLDGVKSIYDIYDITSSFVSWWAGMSSCELCVVHVLVSNPPFVGSLSDVSGVDPLLIVYQNLDPDRKLNRWTPGGGQAGVARQREVRRRRDAAPRASAGATCQLYEWSLDFHLLGWDWIVAPRGFRADFCDGPCPTSPHDLDRVNLSNHAFLRTVHRTILGTSLRQVPAPACVPIRYSPMNILYRASNDTYIFRSVSDMIATSCGCL